MPILLGFWQAGITLAETPPVELEPPESGNVDTHPNEDDKPLVRIPAGDFWMGDHSEIGLTDERPRRLVFVPDFFLSRSEVRFAEWRKVYRWAAEHGYSFENKGRKGWSVYSSNDDHPVTLVNWYDVIKWCNARSEMEQLRPVYFEDELKTKVYRTGDRDLIDNCIDRGADGYRLPTEAEWEKAARGGLAKQFFPWKGGEENFRSQIDQSKANYWPFVRTTSEVRAYPANEYGLHDMAGNVWEWCWDRYVADASVRSSNTDSTTRESTGEIKRVLRGGGWRSAPFALRCSLRFSDEPGDTGGEFGFRIARSYIVSDDPGFD